MKFFIIVTGYNCEDYVNKCYDSIIAQDYNNYHIYFYDDGSADNTPNIIQYLANKHPIKPISYILNQDNKGAAYGRDCCLKGCMSPEDVIIFLGMDDELLPGALTRIKQEYDKGKWMTYGNWINQFGSGLPESFELDFPDHIYEARDYRKVKYRSTAPNTFKRFLYDVIKEDDLKFEGKWMPCCTEGEVMFSCLEQCGKDRIGIIKEPIYYYRESTAEYNKDNTYNGTLRRFGIEYKYKIYNEIINRPKRNLYAL